MRFLRRGGMPARYPNGRGPQQAQHSRRLVQREGSGRVALGGGPQQVHRCWMTNGMGWQASHFQNRAPEPIRHPRRQELLYTQTGKAVLLVFEV